MSKENKKPTEKAAKKKDVITNDNTDAVVEAKTEAAAPKAKSLIIKVEELVPFKDHPYKVIENESMSELIESIKEYGILNPLIVRPLEDENGKYEIISGHRRFFAAQKLGIKKVPCTVHYIDRTAATVLMVDSNCQRTELLPSEKAKAYKMKMDAIKRMPGRKPAENGAPVEPHYEKGKSRDIIAAETGESREQIRRYICLTNLVPELLQYVDEGKIAMRPAVEMSYLDEEVQRDIVDCIDDHGGEVFPSHAQTRRIREKAENGGITYDEIKEIIDEPKPNQVPTYKVTEDMVFKITNRRFTPQEFDEYLKKALISYTHQLEKERQRNQGAR